MSTKRTAGDVRPLFAFYGSKWRIARRYPPPAYETIVEPFAGSAGYALRYANRKVILVERDPIIVGTWRYLLRATPAEIRALPDIAEGQSVDDLPICQEARWLIGWRLSPGSAQPKKTISSWGRAGGPRADSDRYAVFWGSKIRNRIADSVEHIRHWRIIEGDYTKAPDMEATWFVDPPYQKAGRHYRYCELDYDKLAGWCRSRRGQAIVCENTGRVGYRSITWSPRRLTSRRMAAK